MNYVCLDGIVYHLYNRQGCRAFNDYDTSCKMKEIAPTEIQIFGDLMNAQGRCILQVLLNYCWYSTWYGVTRDKLQYYLRLLSSFSLSLESLDSLDFELVFGVHWPPLGFGSAFDKLSFVIQIVTSWIAMKKAEVLFMAANIADCDH